MQDDQGHHRKTQKSLKSQSVNDALTRLKQAKGGRYDKKLFEIKEKRKIYEEVDEETYEVMLDAHRHRPNFVEDDDGLGYAECEDDFGLNSTLPTIQEKHDHNQPKTNNQKLANQSALQKRRAREAAQVPSQQITDFLLKPNRQSTLSFPTPSPLNSPQSHRKLTSHSIKPSHNLNKHKDRDATAILDDIIDHLLDDPLEEEDKISIQNTHKLSAINYKPSITSIESKGIGSTLGNDIKHVQQMVIQQMISSTNRRSRDLVDLPDTLPDCKRIALSDKNVDQVESDFLLQVEDEKKVVGKKDHQSTSLQLDHDLIDLKLVQPTTDTPCDDESESKSMFDAIDSQGGLDWPQIAAQIEDQISDKMMTSHPSIISSGTVLPLPRTLMNNLDHNELFKTSNNLNINETQNQSEMYDDSLLVHWFDAYEDSFYRPGVIHLFGHLYYDQEDIPPLGKDIDPIPPSVYPFKSRSKIPLSATICVVVDNLERILHLSPYPGYTCDDVRQEFDQIRQSLGITTFMSKPVTKSYVFQYRQHPDVPKGESIFLEVIYPFKEPSLPPQLKGRTFSTVIGTSRTAMETFLIDRQLMGPGWIVIKHPVSNSAPMSWCHFECTVKRPYHIEVARFPPSIKKNPNQRPLASNITLPIPESRGLTPNTFRQIPCLLSPLSVLGLKIQAMMNHKTHQNEVIAVSGFFIGHLDLNESNISISQMIRQNQISNFVIIRKLPGIILPPGCDSMLHKKGIHIELTESALLNQLVTKIQHYDPDILVGHKILGFDLDVLLHRFQLYDIPTWSKIGRIRRMRVPRLHRTNMNSFIHQETSRHFSMGDGESDYFRAARSATAGRIICDTYLASIEFDKSQKDHNLTALALTKLQVERDEIMPETIPDYFSNMNKVFELCSKTTNDAGLSIQLMLKLDLIPLTIELTQLGGNLWARSLVGARAERIEYLLLHQFHQRQHLVPDKIKSSISRKKSNLNLNIDKVSLDSINKGGRRKPAYQGGLVLEPKSGFYDQFVLLLDFNSLYPSVIQEHNICFTTIELKPHISSHHISHNKHHPDNENENENIHGNEHENENEQILKSQNETFSVPLIKDRNDLFDDLDVISEPPDPSIPAGILPTAIGMLLTKRQQVKSRLKKENDSHLIKQLDIRQLAIKLVANSLYGCLGFRNFRFFALPLAELITRKGREALKCAYDTVTHMGMDVIYGDTDSIMINTFTIDFSQVRQLGTHIIREINSLFKYLKIDIDSIFRRLLLFKKKKYAALVCSSIQPDGQFTLTQQSKGLDLVRRDCCPLAAEISKIVLKEILSEKPRHDVVDAVHMTLTQKAQEIRSGQIPLTQFVMTNALSKRPEDYPDARSLYHVKVAMDLQQEGKIVRTGDLIQYVIVLNLSDNQKTNIQIDYPLPNKEINIHMDHILPKQELNIQMDSKEDSKKDSKDPNPSSMIWSDVASRAFHPDQFQRQGLQIDYIWYLSHQVLPFIDRLCEFIEGTDTPTLQHCLGLDHLSPSSTTAKISNNPQSDADYSDTSYLSTTEMMSHRRDQINSSLLPRVMLPDNIKYQHVRKWRIICPHCQHPQDFTGLFFLHPLTIQSNNNANINPSALKVVKINFSNMDFDQASRIIFASIHCSKCTTLYPKSFLINNLTLFLRTIQRHYYQSLLVCEDRTCGHTTRYPLHWKRNQPRCLYCSSTMHLTYQPSDLYLQLLYLRDMTSFEHLLVQRTEKDISSILQNYLIQHPSYAIFQALHDQVKIALEFNRYGWIDSSKLFGFFNVMAKPKSGN